MKVYIKPDDNPEYGKIIEGYNSIIRLWNEENGRLLEFKRPKFWLAPYEKRLETLGRGVNKLQSEWLKYNKELDNFILNPRIVIPKDTDRTLTFIHYISILSRKSMELRSNITIILNNYQTLRYELDYRFALGIAVGSALLSVVGTVISIFL